jgi:hypothetical protein
MPLVYSFKAASEFPDETNICICFARNSAIKIRTGSGDFRVFIRRLELHPGNNEYSFIGKVGTTDVQGVYNSLRKDGVIIFVKESVLHSFDATV